MRHALALTLGLLLFQSLAVPAAAADCYADYKAKRDDPLRLHYGIVELGNPCTVAAAERALAKRLKDGWKLLQVISVFGEEELEKRRPGAGDYFLRY